MSASYGFSEAAQLLTISEDELNMFIATAPFSEDDIFYMDEVRTEAAELNMTVGRFLELNPDKRSVPGQQINQHSTRYTHAGRQGNPVNPQDLFQTQGYQQVVSTTDSVLATSNTNSAAVGMVAAMAGKTIQEAALLYPAFLEDTLNGRFSENPEIRALQVAALAPLAQMQEAMEQDFLEQFKAIYTRPAPTREEMYAKMGRHFHNMFHRDRSNPLAILGITETAPQLNAVQE